MFKIRITIGKWLTPQGKSELMDFIVQESHLDEEEAENLWELLDINITDKTSSNPKNKTANGKSNADHQAKPHDSMLYSLDNENFLSKRAFAFR